MFDDLPNEDGAIAEQESPVTARIALFMADWDEHANVARRARMRASDAALEAADEACKADRIRTLTFVRELAAAGFAVPAPAGKRSRPNVLMTESDRIAADLLDIIECRVRMHLSLMFATVPLQEGLSIIVDEVTATVLRDFCLAGLPEAVDTGPLKKPAL
jgi:hypothetical protein